MDFKEAASSHTRRSLPREIFDFLRANKKWWLMPLMITILLLAITAYLSSTAAAPFIYTLF